MPRSSPGSCSSPATTASPVNPSKPRFRDDAPSGAVTRPATPSPSTRLTRRSRPGSADEGGATFVVAARGVQPHRRGGAEAHPADGQGEARGPLHGVLEQVELPVGYPVGEGLAQPPHLAAEHELGAFDVLAAILGGQQALGAHHRVVELGAHCRRLVALLTRKQLRLLSQGHSCPQQRAHRRLRVLPRASRPSRPQPSGPVWLHPPP